MKLVYEQRVWGEQMVGIASAIANVRFHPDVPTCDVCLQPAGDGWCACDEPVRDDLQEEALQWLEVGVTAEEMAMAGEVLRSLGEQIVPIGIHFDVIEDKIISAAADECLDMALAMAGRQAD